ncbi:MFS transporter [Gordonia spumicola]|uniref:MFS transporter n=1 Tax=Gordonia spumicola TaxID=589161 RepID=A0A7I9V9J7_9ACTN|nr:MFS transporter [Gordonia spumicola]GEE01761.1 MFS transporter [Gordonia spumicola]
MSDDELNDASRLRSTNGEGRLGHSGVLFAMCLALILVVASVAALNLALPDLAIDLGANNTALTWIADGYTVALAALVLPIGAVGDRIGRRTVLICGAVVFGLASLAAAFAESTEMLIVWRVVMGIGAAMIMPGTLSTITATFPPAQRSKGVAIWSGFAAAGAIIGMLAAGALLERWGWQSIFIVSAAFGGVAALAAILLAPNTREDTRHRFDLVGAASTTVAVGTLVFAIIEGNERGWTTTPVLICAAVCVLALVVYALKGLRTEHPLLDPKLFGRAGFRAGAIVVFTQFMAVFGFFFVGLQYLQLILDYSPLIAAVALIPVAAVVMPTSSLTPRLVSVVGLKYVMVVGLLLIAGGLVWISRLHADSGYVPFLVGLILAGIGIGLTGSTGTSAIVGSLSRNQQGVASAMNDTTREVGSAVGIAVMGGVFSSQYASHLPDLARLPAQAAEAVRDSAAAGLVAAERIGGPAGAQLGAGVREAFIDGMSAALITVAVVLLIAAIGCAIKAPRHPTSADDAETLDGDPPVQAS